MASVVGIFPDNDSISTLAHALKSGGFDLANLIVISNREPTGYLASIGVKFVAALEPTRIYGDVAFVVPGSRAKQPSDYGSESSSPALEALSDLCGPDGRTDDYLSAVDGGRCVAGYAGERAEAAQPFFASAGGKPVTVF